MFILEAVPAIVLAGVVLKALPDRPNAAKWLSGRESAWLEGQLSEEMKAKGRVRNYSIWRGMLSFRVLLLAIVHFSIVLTVYGVGLFLPQIVKAFDVTVFETGLITTIPYFAACVGILGWGRISDKSGERRLHTVVPLCLAAFGLVLAAVSHSLPVLMLAFSVVAAGSYGCVSAFWTLPSTFLTGAPVAGAIAVISSVGALGGFVGPSIMGLAKDATQSYSAGLLIIALFDVLAIVVLSLIPGLKESRTTRVS